MFPRPIGPTRSDRLLAIAVALVLHGAALGLAALLCEGYRPADLRRVFPEHLGVILWPVRHAQAAPAPLAEQHKRRPAPPRAVESSVEVVVEGEPVIPNAPAVVIDGGVRTPSPRALPAPAPLEDALGDSSPERAPQRRGAAWQRLGVSGAIVTAPRPSSYCVPARPAMPEEARLRGVTGHVEALYDVDEDGVVQDVSVEGEPLLSGAVRSWLEGCLFEPSLQGGQPAQARVKQSFDFKLR